MRNDIQDSLVHYEEINGGRKTFFIGKDMDYFKKGVINLLKTFHPVDPSVEVPTIDSFRPHAKI